MYKIIPFFMIFLFSQDVYAQILGESEAPQMVIPGYSPPGNANPQTAPAPSQRPEAVMPPQKANPTVSAPLGGQNAGPPPGAMPRGMSTPSASPSILQPQDIDMQALMPLANCTPGNFSELEMQIIGWENGKCHLIAKDNVNCFISKSTLSNFIDTAKKYGENSTTETKSAFVKAALIFFSECNI